MGFWDWAPHWNFKSELWARQIEREEGPILNFFFLIFNFQFKFSNQIVKSELWARQIERGGESDSLFSSFNFFFLNSNFQLQLSNIIVKCKCKCLCSFSVLGSRSCWFTASSSRLVLVIIQWLAFVTGKSKMGEKEWKCRSPRVCTTVQGLMP